MKRRIFILLTILLALAALLMTACVPDTPPLPDADAEPPLQSVVPAARLDAPLAITDTAYHDTLVLSDTLRLLISANYPLTGVAPIDAYYDDELLCFIRSAETLAEEYRYDDGNLSGVYFITEEYEIVCNDGMFFSVLRTVSDYFGTNRENYSNNCDTFFAANGQRIGLDDLFTVSRDVYMLRLLEYFDGYIDGYGADRFFADAKQRIRDNFPNPPYGAFCVTDEPDAYLIFYFSPAVIAPHVEGTVEIPVPRDELEDILHNF